MDKNFHRRVHFVSHCPPDPSRVEPFDLQKALRPLHPSGKTRGATTNDWEFYKLWVIRVDHLFCTFALHFPHIIYTHYDGHHCAGAVTCVCFVFYKGVRGAWFLLTLLYRALFISRLMIWTWGTWFTVTWYKYKKKIIGFCYCLKTCVILCWCFWNLCSMVL